MSPSVFALLLSSSMPRDQTHRLLPSCRPTLYRLPRPGVAATGSAWRSEFDISIAGGGAPASPMLTMISCRRCNDLSRASHFTRAPRQGAGVSRRLGGDRGLRSEFHHGSRAARYYGAVFSMVRPMAYSRQRGVIASPASIAAQNDVAPMKLPGLIPRSPSMLLFGNHGRREKKQTRGR